MLRDPLPFFKEMKLHGRPGELGAHALPSGGRRGGTSPGGAQRTPAAHPEGSSAPSAPLRRQEASLHGFTPESSRRVRTDTGSSRPDAAAVELARRQSAKPPHRGDGAGASAGTGNLRERMRRPFESVLSRRGGPSAAHPPARRRRGPGASASGASRFEQPLPLEGALPHLRSPFQPYAPEPGPRRGSMKQPAHNRQRCRPLVRD